VSPGSGASCWPSAPIITHAAVFTANPTIAKAAIDLEGPDATASDANDAIET
jgi:hypothetical protein